MKGKHIGFVQWTQIEGFCVGLNLAKNVKTILGPASWNNLVPFEQKQ